MDTGARVCTSSAPRQTNEIGFTQEPFDLFAADVDAFALQDGMHGTQGEP